MANQVVYELTEEHKGLLEGHNKIWIDNAMSTKKMDEEERQICRRGVEGIYKTAKLAPPVVVFVDGPMTMTVAAALAMSVIEEGIKFLPHKPTSAIGSRVYNAVVQACGLAQPLMEPITPTQVFTGKSFLAGVDYTDLKALCAVVKDYHKFSNELGSKVSSIWQAGNEWSEEACYVEFGRLIAKLGEPPYGDAGKGLDYTNWIPWLDLCIHSGPRVVVDRFCMISDRPEILAVNDFNQPHSVNGPFKLWRDGVGMYSIDGSQVPAIYVEKPETLTADDIDSELNGDVRAALIQIYGAEKWLMDSEATVVDVDYVPSGGGRTHQIMRILMRKEVRGEVIQFVLTHDGSTDKQYSIPVSNTASTCAEAIQSITGIPDSLIIAQG